MEDDIFMRHNIRENTAHTSFGNIYCPQNYLIVSLEKVICHNPKYEFGVSKKTLIFHKLAEGDMTKDPGKVNTEWTSGTILWIYENKVFYDLHT